MKTGWLIILMIVGCLLITVYFLNPTISLKNGTINDTSNIVPEDTPNIIPNDSLKNPVFGEHLQNLPYGQLNVSIGNYNARLPVYVDNMEAGYVSSGKMLSLNVVEGNRTIKVCSGAVCETIDVNILSATKTLIDFEERLNRDLPMGSLNVSIGDYNGILPVYIDMLVTGNVSTGIPLIQVLSPGNHSIRICSYENCYTENVNITPRNQTTIDFGSRLKNGDRQADLVLSIMGYKAQDLPFFIDNVSAGVLSHGTLVTVKVNTGIHDVKVCSGSVCAQEQVEVKFGKTAYVDFSEQLKRNAEFVEPIVRIVDYSLSGSTIIVNAEFINPSAKDLTMTATFSCVYSAINSEHVRLSNSVTSQETRSVRAGDRSVQTVYMYLPYGNDYIYSPPVITRIITN